MKKIIIATALILSTGILSSQTKVANIQPVYTSIHASLELGKKELASGD